MISTDPERALQSSAVTADRSHDPRPRGANRRVAGLGALVYQVNKVLRGWANYFCYGTYTPAFAAVHWHTCRRVRRWLRRKFKSAGQGYRQYRDGYLERELGLLNLNRFPRRHSWAKS